MFCVPSRLWENGCYCVTGLRLHPHFGSDTKSQLHTCDKVQKLPRLSAGIIHHHSERRWLVAQKNETKELYKLALEGFSVKRKPCSYSLIFKDDSEGVINKNLLVFSDGKFRLFSRRHCVWRSHRNVTRVKNLKMRNSEVMGFFK